MMQVVGAEDLVTKMSSLSARLPDESGWFPVGEPVDASAGL